MIVCDRRQRKARPIPSHPIPCGSISTPKANQKRIEFSPPGRGRGAGEREGGRGGRNQNGPDDRNGEKGRGGGEVNTGTEGQRRKKPLPPSPPPIHSLCERGQRGGGEGSGIGRGKEKGGGS